MLNTFILKKYSALLFVGLINCILWSVGLRYGLIWALGMLAAGLLMTIIVGNLLLKNPFTDMLEGKGILALNIDSTGVLRPFIVGIEPPYIKGKLGNHKVDDVFNRSTVLNLAAPIKNSIKAKTITEGEKAGGIKIELDNDTYNKARFALFHYPVIIYNQQIRSVLTKDFLSGLEKDVFAEHTVIYLNKKLEELTSVVRDFGRHIVELTKPGGQGLLQNKWFWIVIIIVLVILLVMFAPKIIGAIQTMMGTVGGAAENVGGGGGVFTPK